jgi:hypothetical protein
VRPIQKGTAKNVFAKMHDKEKSLSCVLLATHGKDPTPKHPAPGPTPSRTEKHLAPRALHPGPTPSPTQLDLGRPCAPIDDSRRYGREIKRRICHEGETLAIPPPPPPLSRSGGGQGARAGAPGRALLPEPLTAPLAP